MILCEYFYPDHNLSWDYAKACGVNHAVMRLPETTDFDISNYGHWQTVVAKLQSYGMTPLVLEPMPNCVHDHIKLGDNLRDASISKVISMLKVMDHFNIRTICFNFMAYIGWLRTRTNCPERGGATVTEFRLDDFVPCEKEITQELLWKNYFYFLDAVLPYAEKYGIHLALHPDDPPVNPLGKIERIFVSPEQMFRAITEKPSPFLGLTFCQAVYYLMGANLFELIPAWKDYIRFIHFRNVLGTKVNFRETFHDNGVLPMAKLMELYYDIGLHVPIRPDHVPQMPGEVEAPVAGYGSTGKLFAIGYLKGLMEASQNKNVQK